MYKTKNENSAITLIALVITIIVLLILAGLTLTFVLGENGLFGKARNAKEETEKAQAVEDIKLKIIEVQTVAAVEGRIATLEDLYNKLEELQDEEYKITTSAQTASLTNDSDPFEGAITKLYIRNMKYSYVVEVESNLQVENDVQTASGAGSTSNGTSGGTQTGTGTQTSGTSDLLSCEIQISEQGTLSVNNVQNIEFMSIIKDNKFKDVTKNSTYNIGSTGGVDADIYAIVMDKDLNLYKSNTVTFCMSSFVIYDSSKTANLSDAFYATNYKPVGSGRRC